MTPPAAPVVIGSNPADRRPILFVGDIQGCAEELAQLLERAEFRPGQHRLLPVGDTVNRGPDAAATLHLLQEVGAEPILGNHELSLLELHADALPSRLAENPQSAARQLYQAGRWTWAREWMETWPHARLGPGWVLVHAGLHPALPLEATPPEFLANVRYCTPTGERPDAADGNLAEAPSGFQPWFDFYRGPRTVVFGHWARRGLVWRERIRGLDSGCVYGGPLSGLWWPEGRLVQVPSTQLPRRL